MGKRLADACDIVMGQSPPGVSCNTDNVGLPLLNGPTEYGPYHPTPVQFTADARKRARVGDLLFCVRGSTTGRMNWADQEYAIGRGVAAIRHRSNPHIQPFVRAVIEYGLPELLAQATGSTFPNVSADQLAGLWWPPLEDDEQRAIAHILGTLDDKIELNRRMGETLEAIARALFKSWFVDFDPVRANAEGRDPGLPKPLADLFPARLVDSELGEIPEGWEVKSIAALAEVTSGKRPDVRYSEQSEQAAVPLWGGNGPMAFVSEALVDEPILLTGRVGTLGSVFRITTPCWPSDNTLVLRAKEAASFEYLFYQLQQIDFPSLNRGSTQPLLAQSDLKAQLILVPHIEVLNRFSGFAWMLYRRIDELDGGSRTLAALRDTLLPKLVSGELRVKDAEKLIGRAV